MSPTWNNWLKQLVCKPRTIARRRRRRKPVRLRAEALESRTVPALYNVTTTADVVDANDGLLSLREAVLATNSSVGVADTINVPAGTYVLTVTGAPEDAAATGDLDISGDVTIQGASAAGTIVDGNLSDRVFDIQSGNVTLANLTVRNGVSPSGYIAGNLYYATGYGGGIRSLGTLIVSGCVVTDNRAVGTDRAGNLPHGDAYGGGIYESGGGLTVTDSVIQNNFAHGGGLTTSDFDVFAGAAVGGGVVAAGSALFVTRSLITGNQAIGGNADGTVHANITGGEALGGGIVVFNSAVHQIVASTIAFNRAVGGNGTGPVIGDGGNASAGGLWLSGTGTVSNCTVSGNQALGGTGTTTGTGTGGSGGQARGGGIIAEGGLITNSTITLNTATGGGSNRTVGMGTGGGFNYRFGASGTNETFSSTIVAGNSATTAPSDIAGTSASASLGNNLIGIGTGAAGFIDGLNGDQVGSFFAPIDPLLGPLANNGGLSPTHTPLLTSPAINRGSNVEGFVTDQRGLGFPRVSGPAPDVGAVELSYPLAWATVQAPIVSPGGTSARFTVTYRDDRAVAVGTLGTGDLRVTGPNGFSVVPDFVAVDVSGDGTPRTATYSFAPPGGSWDAADNGAYSVLIEAGQVTDVDGNAVPAGVAGTFQIGVPFVVLNANNSGPGSLRAALLAANAAPGWDTVSFDPAVFATPRTISLTSGPLAVNDSVTVTGPGAAFVTLNGNNRDRIMVLNNAAIVSLSGLTFTGGLQPFSGNASGGGAILGVKTDLTVRDCVFTGNSSGSRGGAIEVQGSGGSLTIMDSVFTNNSSSVGGGAVSATSSLGDVNLIRSTFIGNTTTGLGGALSDDGNSSDRAFTADECTFDSNTAGGRTDVGTGGGGLYVSDLRTTISRSTFSGNLAKTGPGGGALIRYKNTAVVQNSTVSGNTAAYGGGLYLTGSGTSLRVINSTVVGNTAFGGVGSNVAGGGLSINATGPEVRSCIVSGNTGSLAPDIRGGNVLVTDSAVGDPAGFTLAAGSGNNLPYGTDVRLGPLADNGGPTKTHALLAGSPAIDAGSNPDGVFTDQRGYGSPRTAGRAPDMGAFELIPTGTPAATAGLLADITRPGGTSYDFTVTFRDDVAVTVASLGTGDVRVTGPNGFTAVPTFLGVDLDTDGTPRTATYRLTPPGGTWDYADIGSYSIDLVGNEVADTAGNVVPAVRLGQFQFTTTRPVSVSGVVVNDGSQQRSRVTSLKVYFDGPVRFLNGPAGTFQVRRADGTDVPFSTSLLVGPTGNVVTLTFTGTGLDSGSLRDGTYTLTVIAAAAVNGGSTGPLLDADGDRQPGGDLVFQFHRLFGDVNGDRAVNGLDLAAFRGAFGTISTNAGYLAYLDFNGDGAINGTDLTQFRNRFGVILP